ncbi:UvrD-helicase domain-containing protein [Cellulomonas sp. P5_C6]
MTAALPPYSAIADLPTGATTMLLEASAGTGKTHAIADLVTRFVVEAGYPIEQIAVMTFGRAATSELRGRIRRRLVAVQEAAATGDDDGDRVLRSILRGAVVPLDTAVARLDRAIATFDGATITTIHQLCQQILAGLGTAGDTDPSAVLEPDLDDLVTAVVDDLYVRDNADRPAGSAPAFASYKAASDVARKVVGDPTAQLLPEPPGPLDAERLAFARDARLTSADRKRRARLLGFDDLLGDAAAAVRPTTDPERAPSVASAVANVRGRWPVVLVDEFQDTDPVQWELLREAFHGACTLVLVGDPKQAIYAFRGGDVETYQTAARSATVQRTLDQNWRSDEQLVTALGTLLADQELGAPDIRVHPVHATQTVARLRDDAGALPPVRVRRVGDGSGLTVGTRGLFTVDPVRDLVARDLAADIGTRIASGTTQWLGSPDHPGGQPLHAGHFAVLVPSHKLAAQVRDELSRVGVPAVLVGTRSVYATRAAEDWLTLLRALEQPHRTPLARAAAIGPFLGVPAVELAGDAEVDDRIGTLLRGWAGAVHEHGVAALLELQLTQGGLAKRLLAEDGGARRYTDLRQIGEALHVLGRTERLGLSAMRAWLQARRDEGEGDADGLRGRRLDSDAEAVQILTLHASKGLQYPIVYLPFAFDRSFTTSSPQRVHVGGVRSLYVGSIDGSSTPEQKALKAQEKAEAMGEERRLTYVALTRAKSQVVVWWAPTSNAGDTALTDFLVGEALRGRPLKQLTDREAADAMAAWQDAGAIVAEDVTAVVDDARPPAASAAGAVPVAARLGRRFGSQWRRLSFTGLTRDASHGAPAAAVGLRDGVEADVTVVSDEPPGLADARDDRPGDEPDVPTPTEVGAHPSPLADLPSSAAFGIFAHALLEQVDPRATDLRAELLRHATAQLLLHPVQGVTADALADAFVPVLRTPLGPLVDGRSLSDLATTDRLAELDFELPLVGGDQQPDGSALRLGRLAEVFRATVPPDDPLAAYADRLSSRELADQGLHGYLTGSIDAVLRVPAADRPDRFVVVDYKTNWLGRSSARLSADDYTQDAMAGSMIDSGYPLQALLYSVALHRFLRWRQPGYDAATHLGGVLYLYVRGMCGPDSPVHDGQASGVFAWEPPAALVVALSDLLDEGER